MVTTSEPSKEILMFDFIVSPTGTIVFILCAIVVAIMRRVAQSFHNRLCFRINTLGDKVGELKSLLGILAVAFLLARRYLFWGFMSLAATSFGMQAAIYLITRTHQVH
jgi:hypothetical protein